MYNITQTFTPYFEDNHKPEVIAQFKYKWQAILYKFFFYDLICDPAWLGSFKIGYEENV
jgi:hypothetical protein